MDPGDVIMAESILNFFLLFVHVAVAIDCDKPWGKRIVDPIGRVLNQPPKQPPAEMLDLYTRCSTVPVTFLFVDDTNGGHGTHYVYPLTDVEKMMDLAQQVGTAV